MNKFISLCMSIIMLTCFSGCMEAMELKERTIIEAIGIDKKDDMFILTMQKFIPDAKSSEATGSGGATSSFVQTNGRSVSEAIDKVTHYHGNEVFLGNSSYIIIGRDAAKDSLESILDFFNSTHEITPEIRCVMSDRSAEEIVKAEIKGQQSPSSRVGNLLEQGKRNGLAGSSSLREIITRIQSDASEPYMPIISVVQDDSKESQLKIAGMAVFKNNKLADVLSIEEAKGVLWTTGEIRHSIVSFDYLQGTASTEIIRANSKIKVSIKNNAPVLTLNISCDCILGEVSSPSGGGANLEDITNIQSILEKKIENTVLNSVNKVFYGDKCDVFRFSDYIRNSHPDFWKQNKENWDKLIESSTFEVDVDCNIDRPGLQAKPTQS